MARELLDVVQGLAGSGGVEVDQPDGLAVLEHHVPETHVVVAHDRTGSGSASSSFEPPPGTPMAAAGRAAGA